MTLFLSWFRILRVPNLLIVAFTEYALYFFLLIPLFRFSEVPPALNGSLFFLLVLATLIVTLGGYIVNDIFDREIDQVNKPDRVWVGNSLSVFTTKILYGLLNLAGFATAILTAIGVGDWRLSLLYPLGAVSLYWYSWKLKKTAFWGNFFVSIFCGLVVLLVMFAERESLASSMRLNPDKTQMVRIVFFGFAFFGFLVTLIREMVKDVEDLEGDISGNSQSLPISLGTGFSKMLISGFSGVLLLFLGIFAIWNFVCFEQNVIPGLYSLILFPLAVIPLMVWLKDPQEQRALAYFSRGLKILMVAGLIYLFIFYLMYF